MRWLRTLVVGIGIGIASPTAAFNEPNAFRGVPWGATEEALRDKLGETSAHGILWDKCGPFEKDQRWLGDRFCSGAFPLSGVRMEAVYRFRRDRFVGVSMTFPASDFETIAAVFRERFGPPTTSKQERFTTKGGLEATNRVDQWAGAVILIRLERFSGSIDTGQALLETHQSRQESLRLRQEQIKGAAKDL